MPTSADNPPVVNSLATVTNSPMNNCLAPARCGIFFFKRCTACRNSSNFLSSGHGRKRMDIWRSMDFVCIMDAP